LYPLLFYPIHMERIWGGNKLKVNFARELGDKPIGESWELACHKNGNSIISNGYFKGKSLGDLISDYGQEILGSAIYNDRYNKFPLLVKLIDARDWLSVQVHPNDNYACEFENGELGKTEAWYIIDAIEDARIVYGLKEGISKKDFRACVDKNRIGDCLKELKVKAGDVVYIPAGMVHALGEGILVYEIQQSSDTTYRIYDWDRVDRHGHKRDLHVEKAMDVISFNSKYQDKIRGLRVKEDGGDRIVYIANRYFAVERLITSGSMSLALDGKRFQILTCIDGSGDLVYEKGSIRLNKGSSCLVPASLSEPSLKGNLSVIRSYVPDREKNLIKPLLLKGYLESDLEQIAALFD